MTNHSSLITIDHPLCRATILRQGAQLISYIPTTGALDMLWSSDLSHYTAGKAFRGGVPICWPWFGKAHSPAHGFARLMPWELISRDDSDTHVHLEFRLTDTPKSREIWPHPFTLRLHMHLGTTCEIRLDIDTPVTTTGALHTYLSTSDITHSFISGLGDCYIDSLQENVLVTTDQFPIQIHREVDRIYTRSHGNNILETPEKAIRLIHQGHSDIVVWNPWVQRSAQIPDMKKDDYLHMVCIETARITQSFDKHDSIALTMIPAHLSPPFSVILD